MSDYIPSLAGVLLPPDVWSQTPVGRAHAEIEAERQSALGELHAAMAAPAYHSRLWSLPPARNPNLESNFYNRPLASNRKLSREQAWQLVDESYAAATLVQCIIDTFVGTGFVARSEARGTISLAEVHAPYMDRAMPGWLVNLIAEQPANAESLQAADVLTAYFDDWSLHAMTDGTSLYDGQRALEEEAYISGRAGLLQVGRGKHAGKLHLIRSVDIVQPLKPDPMDKGRQIVDGVVYDEDGVVPVGFYLSDAGKPTRYDARDIIFEVYRRNAAPAFVTTFNKIHQLDAGFEAALVCYRIAACFGMIRTREHARGKWNRQTTDANGNKTMQLQPGMVVDAEPGDKFEQIKPEHPNQQFEVFITEALRAIGMPDRIPLEWFTCNFAKTTYSGGRMAGEMMKKRVKSRHDHLIYGPLARIWQWRVSKAIKDEQLPAIEYPWAHKWQAPPWGFMDPQTEAQADQMLEDAAVKTYIDRCDEQGLDWRAQKRKQAQVLEYEKQLETEKGVQIAKVASSATRQVLPTVAATPAPSLATPAGSDVLTQKGVPA
jgi:capsid protein